MKFKQYKKISNAKFKFSYIQKTNLNKKHLL